MKEQWIDRLQRQMEALETKAPDGLLDDIKAEMARRGVVPSTPPRQKAHTVPLWVVRTTACAAVVFFFIWLGVNYLQNFSSPKSNPIAQKESAISTKNGKTATIYPTSKERASSLTKKIAAIRHVIADFSHKEEQPLLAVAMPNANGKVEQSSQAPTLPTDKNEDGKPQNTEEKAGNQHHAHPNTAYTPLADRRKSNLNQGRIEIGAHYQNCNANSNAHGNLLSASSANSVQNSPVIVTASPAFGVTMLPPDEETHHRQPIKFGISVRYHLTERIAIQSGVNYSYHSSDFTTGGQTTEQRLNFIGIPISASYDIWRNRHVNLYASAGGEVEKLVKGKLTTETAGKRANTSVKMSQPQLSATAAIGVEYKATESLRVYVEPGLAYHFDNNSNVQTIYSDKPCTFNLNIGVRLDL